MISELFLEDLSLWGCVWQSTLFAVIGLAGSFLWRRRPARASGVLFLAVMATVFVPAMSLLVRHFELGLLTEEPIALPSFEIEIPIETTRILPAPEIRPIELEEPADFELAESGSGDVRIPWRLIALYGWMITTLILLGRLFVAFVSGIRLLRRAKSDCCEHIRRAADAARARLGITRHLNVRSSEQVHSPMIWCWSRPPVLLVPEDLDERIDWVDVICHELAHWRRWDHISGLIAELAVCILPWNPLLWWSKRRMVRLSEQACDDWVLAGGCTGADYAQSLLNLSPELKMAFLPTVIGKEKPMKERIYRIVKEKCSIPYVGLRWALVVTVIAASVMVGVAFAQERPARVEPLQPDDLQPAAEQRERQVLTERMTDLRNQAHELKARMDQVRAELAKLQDSGKGESEEAQAHRAELRELEEAIAPVEREIQGLEGELHGRQMRPEADQEPRREMLRRLEELGHETEMVLQALAEQNFGRNEEANMLYRRMRELNEQMQQVRQQLGRQIADTDRQRPEFRREAPPEQIMTELGQLRQRAGQIEFGLQQLGDRNPERAEKLRAELRSVRQEIFRIEMEREVGRRGLQERARELERRLQELGDSHPEEAQELRMQLDQIHQRIEKIERELGITERPHPQFENLMQQAGEERREQLMAKLEQLQAKLRERELVLRELNEQGKAQSEEAQMRRQQLRELQEQLQATENEIHQSEPGRVQEPGRDKLEREVQDLRKQMDNVNQQMGEMRELIKRLLDLKKAKSQGPDERIQTENSSSEDSQP